MIPEKREDIRYQLIIAVVLTVAVFSFFQFVLPYHLFLKEQTQLYLFTADYFLSYFNKPAWLASNLGEFLTQFFYLRGGGATVLTLLFLIEWLLIIYVLKSFRVQQLVSLYALYPVAAEWIMHTDLDYQLSHTLSLILLLVFYSLYTFFRRRWTSLIAGLLIGVGLYSFIGAASLLFPVLVVGYDSRNGRGTWPFWLALLALVVTTIQLSRSYYLLTEQQMWMYPFTSYWHLLPLAFLVCGVFLIFQNPYTTARQAERNVLVASSLLILFWVGGLVKNVNLEKEKVLALSSEVYFNNWDRVDELLRKNDLQNNIVAYYTNITLSGRNELADKLLDYYQPVPDGMFLPVDPASPQLTMLLSGDVYFHLGDKAMAEYAAMSGMIFSPKQRSSRMVKRLAEINLINEDSLAACKYLRMLDATLFHRNWALKHEQMLHEQDSSANPWLQQKRSQLVTSDTLRSPNDYIASLTLLVESNPANKSALDYLLCYYLLDKDLASFVTAYNRWYKNKIEYIPKLYSEALLIYLVLEKTPEKVIQSYKLPADRAADFVKYTQLFEETEDEMSKLREEFSKTYWFYFHFVQMVNK